MCIWASSFFSFLLPFLPDFLLPFFFFWFSMWPRYRGPQLGRCWAPLPALESHPIYPLGCGDRRLIVVVFFAASRGLFAQISFYSALFSPVSFFKDLFQSPRRNASAADSNVRKPFFNVLFCPVNVIDPWGGIGKPFTQCGVDSLERTADRLQALTLSALLSLVCMHIF